MVEKPKEDISPFAVTGLYFYRGQGVFDYIDSLRPSARGELEITELNTLLLEHGKLWHQELPGYWTDAGTHESLWKANYLLNSTKLEGNNGR